MTNGTTNTAAQSNNTPAVNNNQPAVQVIATEKTIADHVLNKIKVFQDTGSINIPKEYSPANALKAAWLILLETKTLDKKPVLDVCTKESIANAMLKMIVQGLNPVKRQCSFIAYGSQLQMQREYAGTIAIAKRDANVETVIANAVFKEDEFVYEIDPESGIKKIIKHIQTIEGMESMDIKAAYAIVTYKDGKKKTEIMSMQQIRKAWEQGPMKGQSPAHKNFPDQMACKTVIGRALKIDINSSDDAALFDEDENRGNDDVKAANVKMQIENGANKKELPDSSVDEFVDATVLTEGEDKKEVAAEKPNGPKF